MELLQLVKVNELVSFQVVYQLKSLSGTNDGIPNVWGYPDRWIFVYMDGKWTSSRQQWIILTCCMHFTSKKVHDGTAAAS